MMNFLMLSEKCSYIWQKRQKTIQIIEDCFLKQLNTLMYQKSIRKQW